MPSYIRGIDTDKLFKNTFFFVFGTQLRRAILLFLVPLLLSCSFFLSLSISTLIVFTINKQHTNPTLTAEQSQKQVADFSESLSDWSQLMKLPIAYLSFNVYGYNKVQAKTVYAGKLSTLMNVSTENVYTHHISTGSIRKVFGNTKIANLPFEYTVSFDFQTTIPNTLLSSEQDDNDQYYYFFIWPTGSSFYILWFSIIAVEYALMVTISSWARFIKSGTPILSN